MKTRTETVIDVREWDTVVSETYGRPYSFQQQDGCKDRGVFRFTVEALISAVGMRCADDMERARKSMHVHINRLRNQLIRYSSPLRVYTVRGAGYRLEEVASHD